MDFMNLIHRIKTLKTLDWFMILIPVAQVYSISSQASLLDGIF